MERPFDRRRNVRRNFAFVVFEEEGAADAAAQQPKQKFGERLVRGNDAHLYRPRSGVARRNKS